MKSIKNYILEAFKINKNTKLQKYNYFPQTKEELKDIIEQRIADEGNECDLNDIDVSEITDMSCLFYKFSKFNGDISGWDVSNVKFMIAMFQKSNFNGDISNWNVSNVKNMEAMFKESKFNQDISGWDVSNVENMHDMFDNSNFNQDISNWDVSNNRHFETMFKHSKFNQDISKWPINPNVYFSRMFYGSDFNQNLSNWKISKGAPKYLSEMFKNTPMQDKKEFYPKRK